jgi:predicted DsbA family dithiol-disulfide isomerase
MAVKEKKKTFNFLFAAVSVASLFIVLSVFSYTSRQLAVKASPLLPDSRPLLERERIEVKDPFISAGPGAEKILLEPIIDGRDPQLGLDDAPVTIVEFSDFSCSFCAEQEKIIKEVLAEYQGKVRLIWKDLPDAGGLSYSAALAARCAHEQRKFWSAHDFLFSGREAFSASLAEAALKIGLDAAKFETCLSQRKYDNDIIRNIKEAGALRLPGVPFFFVGGQEYLGAINKEDLEEAIKQSLYERKN